MQLAELAEISATVAATSARNAKVAILAEALSALAPEERASALAMLVGELRQGRIGVGYKALMSALEATEPASAAVMSIAEVDAVFAAIARESGAGSSGRRQAHLEAVLGKATRAEREFLVGVLGGGLRQGALEGVMVTALAKAAGVKVAAVKRALMFAGDLPSVAEAALERGLEGLKTFTLTHFRPVRPMLAATAQSPAEALEQLGTAAFEIKLDGARIQVHRLGDDVRIYTRQLNEVTRSLPEVVERCSAWPARSFVLDGEVLARFDDGSPQPFQETMRRFGRIRDVDTLRETLPLHPVFFDCLEHDGRVLIDEDTADRRAALEALVPAEQCIERLVTSDRAAAEAFQERALEAGHEGIMAKSPEGAYRAGSRAKGWLKIKPVHTLDLVVLAAEWGHGRRDGWLSNLHLGARDPETGTFVMLGKTFKGLTDELLAWQTKELLARETHREGITVHVRPELVVEIALSDVQTSPQYPAGLALRFARVRAYRPDKTPLEADTLDTVHTIHQQGHR